MSDKAPESERTMEWNPASACRYCGLRFGDPVSDCMGPHRRESDPPKSTEAGKGWGEQEWGTPENHVIPTAKG